MSEPIETTAPDMGAVLKSVEDLNKSLDTKFVTKDEAAGIVKAMNDIKHEIATIKVSEPNVVEDPKRGFKHVGEFVTAVMKASDPTSRGAADERLAVVTKGASSPTGMNLASGPDGGYTLPPAFNTGIWDTMRSESESLLNLVDRHTVEGESLTFNANAETSRANGSRWGGVRGYWKAEVEQMTGSRPKFRQLKLEPQELYVFGYATDKSLRNSPVALGNYLTSAFADELNFVLGDAIFNGDGVGKPKGVVTSGSVVTVSKETSQASATLQQENVSKMWARLHPKCRKNAVWFLNCDVEPQLDFLNTVVKNVAGTENVGGYANKVYDPEKRTLKGRPIVTSEYCATLGTLNDIVLWDPTTYAAGTRGSVDSAMSMHLRFDYAETAFRLIFEADGQSWLASAITPFKGSNTLTNIVNLQAR